VWLQGVQIPFKLQKAGVTCRAQMSKRYIGLRGSQGIGYSRRWPPIGLKLHRYTPKVPLSAPTPQG
jgi:hypothetical protein